jgi:hypothetical protein
VKIETNVKAGASNGEVVIGSTVKAGGISSNNNQTVAHGLKVKTNVKAGVMMAQHNQTMARALKVKTGIKAGQNAPPTIRD